MMPLPLNIRVKIQFERLETWQLNSKQKFTLPNYFPCPTGQNFKLRISCLSEDLITLFHI